ncbi:MAG: hypothetical protein WC548_04200 [Candidatus Pacearchaeota archaeon]
MENNTEERALTFVKPEGLIIWRNLYSYLDGTLDAFRQPFQASKFCGLILSEEVVRGHYSHVFPRILDEYVKQFVGKELAARIYTGEFGLIGCMRKILGVTDPSKSESWTIRGKFFGKNSLDEALSKGMPVENGMHISGGREEGSLEISRFLPYLYQWD